VREVACGGTYAEFESLQQVRRAQCRRRASVLVVRALLRGCGTQTQACVDAARVAATPAAIGTDENQFHVQFDAARAYAHSCAAGFACANSDAISTYSCTYAYVRARVELHPLQCRERCRSASVPVVREAAECFVAAFRQQGEVCGDYLCRGAGRDFFRGNALYAR